MFGSFTYAQSNFDKQITEKSGKLRNANTLNEYDNLFHEFSLLAKTKNPNQWKAYYFASLSLYKKAELLLPTNNLEVLMEINALSYKYANGILNEQSKNTDLITLIDLIEKQKKLINESNK